MKKGNVYRKWINKKNLIAKCNIKHTVCLSRKDTGILQQKKKNRLCVLISKDQNSNKKTIDSYRKTLFFCCCSIARTARSVPLLLRMKGDVLSEIQIHLYHTNTHTCVLVCNRFSRVLRRKNKRISAHSVVYNTFTIQLAKITSSSIGTLVTEWPKILWKHINKLIIQLSKASKQPD